MQTLVDLSVQSLGLLPLMALVFLAAVMVIVERLNFFVRSMRVGKQLVRELAQLPSRSGASIEKLSGRYAGSPHGALLKRALASGGQAETDFERAVDEEIMLQMPRLDKRLWVLDTAVTLGPLLGLFGTIVGMINSFDVLGSSGTGNPMAVSGGIAHALIATATGLTIAIVGVALLNYLNKRVRNALLQMELIKSMLVRHLAA
ncbi:MotA/TolQ/ExbB proton channel family protein [Burkholderia sp. Ac-20379]|nr:MotA/TolQ/ExbB proton channel family protein [Burkholderia sp. Ac-20379]